MSGFVEAYEYEFRGDSGWIIQGNEFFFSLGSNWMDECTDNLTPRRVRSRVFWTLVSVRI